ncbi:MAG: hypothetical protein LBO00_05000 [Zoogloeaceae bacterium]|jgi:hypothetical protein|nr:hypothetical protein [Zoogloeaceae bacterium]
MQIQSRSIQIRRFLPSSLAAALLLAGCAGNPLRSYDSEMQGTLSLVRSGQVDAALTQLEQNNGSLFSSSGDAPKDKDGNPKETTVLDSTSGKDILYFFEKGELLKLQQSYEKSRDSWLAADEIVRVWEDEYRTNPTKVVGEIGAFLISDRTRRYDGQDYEKVFLSTKLMLNHVLLGNADHARIEMKKTFEREKLIESFREKEYDKIREAQEKQGDKTTTKDLQSNGYPLEELDSPEVRSLKNGYQNAFAHYLAGYFFEQNGEYSLAEPGYRNALALQPGSKLIREKVGSVGRAKPGPNESDVLFVLESGFAPAWKSVTVPLPVRLNQRYVATPLSFPVIKTESRGYVPATLTAGGKTLPVETLVNVDAMARRLLKDQLPGIIGRTVVRAIAKSALQYQAQKSGGAVAGLVVGVLSVATEQADERAWRTLPERLAIARAILPRGEQNVEFQTGSGLYRGKIQIDGKMTIIPIRLVDGRVYLGGQSHTFAAAGEVGAPTNATTTTAPKSSAPKSTRPRKPATRR